MGGIVANLLGSDKIDDIVERFTKITRKGALINWKRGGNSKRRDGREGKSRIDGGIVVGDGGTTGRGGRSHGEEPKRRCREGRL